MTHQPLRLEPGDRVRFARGILVAQEGIVVPHAGMPNSYRYSVRLDVPIDGVTVVEADWEVLDPIQDESARARHACPGTEACQFRRYYNEACEKIVDLEKKIDNLKAQRSTDVHAPTVASGEVAPSSETEDAASSFAAKLAEAARRVEPSYAEHDGGKATREPRHDHSDAIARDVRIGRTSQEIRDEIITKVGMMAAARTPEMQARYDAAVARERDLSEVTQAESEQPQACPASTIVADDDKEDDEADASSDESEDDPDAPSMRRIAKAEEELRDLFARHCKCRPLNTARLYHGYIGCVTDVTDAVRTLLHRIVVHNSDGGLEPVAARGAEVREAAGRIVAPLAEMFDADARVDAPPARDA